MSNVFEWVLDTECEKMAGLRLNNCIPTIISHLAIQPIGQLADGSIAMLILLPGPVVSEFPTR
ncbi:hypothetical protein KBY71_12510 [Cyanobium sp. T1B-Tous]|uniref:hypothetical protein n=1 Tax=Cyanobium sp. T1B-Tous TaxID=2823721 RepID=UPI0020CB7605|nr:hypothetical protein [Cyanobium sp. T1B-Tous]MCP9807334.1 hypothetical protein [Cyanobium sp. T1B-Tous]